MKSPLKFNHLALILHSSFYNTTTPTDIYTLSLHDALPILARAVDTIGRGVFEYRRHTVCCRGNYRSGRDSILCEDRKSTRLNSSHRTISYAVFCLKKKNYLKYPQS